MAEREAAGASPSRDAAAPPAELREVLKHRALPAPLRWLVAAATLAAIGLAVNQLFNLGLLGVTLLDPQYLYLLALFFMAMTFLTIPAGKSAPMDRVPLYDMALAAAAVVVIAYFVMTSHQALMQGWREPRQKF
jgi:TRAP-type uncharacterized transport system fused permease subunit